MENKTYNKNEAREKMNPSFESTLPQMPADFTERVMKQIEAKPATNRRWRWVAAAACILLIIGIGVTITWTSNTIEAPVVAKVETESNAQQLPSESELGEEKPQLQTEHAMQQEELQTPPLTPSLEAAHSDKQHTAAQSDLQNTAARSDAKNVAELTDTSSDNDRLNYYIARLEAEMDALDDSVSSARVEQLIAADVRLQQLVNRIVKEQVEQAMNEQAKDSTANYITF